MEPPAGRVPAGGKRVLLGTAAVLLWGAYAARQLPMELLPDVELPSVSVTASWPGASPLAVERLITASIERTLDGIPGTARLESFSSEGRATVRLQVSEERDLDLYVAEVSDRLAALRPTLPAGVVPTLLHDTPPAFREEAGFMTLQLIGSIDPLRLRALAETTVASRLRGTPGIAGIEIEGGQEQEILVSVDPARLQAYGVSAAAIRQGISEALEPAMYGSLSSSGRSVLLMNPGTRDLRRLRQVVLQASSGGEAIRLADVAEVDLRAGRVRTISRIDGKPVVTVVLDRATGSHLLHTARAVHETLAEIRTRLPREVELSVADDQSARAFKKLKELASSAPLALAGILFILFARFRSGRAAALALLPTAASVSVALVAMWMCGLTLNLFTISGLLLTTGILVANTVLLLDHFLDPPVRAGRASRLDSPWVPAIGSALCLVAVLVSLACFEELRALLAPFAAVVILCQGFSLVGMSVLVPTLARGARRDAPSLKPRSRGARAGLDALFQLAARYPKASLLLLFLLLGLPTPLLPALLQEPATGWSSPARARLAGYYNTTLGSDRAHRLRERLDPLIGGILRPFLQKVDLARSGNLNSKPELLVRLKLPTGSGIGRADELIAAFEQESLASAAVHRTFASIGEDRALLRVQLRDDHLTTSAAFSLRQRLIDQAIQIAGVEISVSGLSANSFHSGSGTVDGLLLDAFGSNYGTLDAEVSALADRLRLNPRVADVDVHAEGSGPDRAREHLSVRWEGDVVLRTGLPAREAAEAVSDLLFSETPFVYADLNDGDRRTPVRMVRRGADRDLFFLLREPIFHAAVSRRPAKLAEMSDLTLSVQPSVIRRSEQQYKRQLLVYFRGPYKLGREMLDRELAATRLPPGYRIEQPRHDFLSWQEKLQVLHLLSTALGLLILALAAVLESWRLPFVALQAIPMAGVGVATAFLFSGKSFNEGAFLGALLLLGISVQSSLLLLSRYRRLRSLRPTTPSHVLARLAVRQRLALLWTSTLVIVGSLLPILLLPETGDLWSGMGVTLAGGLLSSSLLVPFALVASLSLRRPCAAALRGDRRK